MAARRNSPAPAARALTTRKEQVESVRGLIERYKPQMEMALPSTGVTPARMARLFMTCVAVEPKLLECTQTSLIGSMMQLCQLGLEPGLLGQAYLLPYRNNKDKTMECQVIPGYKGLLKLARNSGQILGVQAYAVYKQDHFEFQLGLEPILNHIPTEEAVTPDDLRYAYAIVGLKGSTERQWEVMNRREIMEVKSSSRAGDSGPWKTHTAEMWKKTVLRRICKLLPASVELQTAISLDEAVDVGIPQNLDIIEMETEPAETGEGE